MAVPFTHSGVHVSCVLSQLASLYEYRLVVQVDVLVLLPVDVLHLYGIPYH